MKGTDSGFAAGSRTASWLLTMLPAPSEGTVSSRPIWNGTSRSRGTEFPRRHLRRFWTMLAHTQGQLLNAAQLGRALAVDCKIIARYLDLMVDLLLVRRLSPYHANVRKRLVNPRQFLPNRRRGD